MTWREPSPFEVTAELPLRSFRDNLSPHSLTSWHCGRLDIPQSVVCPMEGVNIGFFSPGKAVDLLSVLHVAE